MSSLLSFFEITRLRDEIFSNTLELSPENFQRDAFYYKDTLDDTQPSRVLFSHLHTHTPCTLLPHARAPRLLGYARGTFSFKRFEKFHEREENVSDSCEFLDPFVSRVVSECFFFFPLFLSLNSLVVVDLDDDDRCRSNNAKDLRIGWSPARSSSRYRLCESAIFKEEEQEREREKKVVSRVVSSSKKKIVLFLA